MVSWRARSNTSSAGSPAIVRDKVHGPVVKQQERGVEAGDHQVLVVARVGDDRRAGRGRAAGPRTARRNRSRTLAVRLAASAARRAPGSTSARRHRPSRGRRPACGRWASSRLRRPAQAGGPVEGHVMVHELAHERRACRMRGVVGVVLAELRIDDERYRSPADRSLASRGRRACRSRAGRPGGAACSPEERVEPGIRPNRSSRMTNRRAPVGAWAWAAPSRSEAEVVEATAPAPSMPRNRLRLMRVIVDLSGAT